MSNKNKKYYAFHRAGAMAGTGHKFVDDVALCKAASFRQAKKIFSKYYADIKDDEIVLVSGMINNYYGEVMVLTDY